MFIIVQLLLLIFLFLGISYFIRLKQIRLLLSIIFSLFIVLQIVSYYFGSSLIDYKFYEHVSLKDAWSLRGFYFYEIIGGTITFMILTFTLFLLSKFSKKKFKRAIFSLSIILIALIGLSFKGGVLSNLYEIYSIKNTEEKTFDETLINLGIDPETYIKPGSISAEPGKNIIVISLESLEHGFLNPPHEELTPNLSRLANKYTKYNMVQSPGSDYTEASIYTSITGVPAFFRSPKNEIFQNTQLNDISNLGMVLSLAGYDMTYYIAKKEFSGVDNMLSSFGFTVKSETDLEVTQAEGFWGLHDKDLFEAVEEEIRVKSKADKPFAIFLNTISGHFPNGVYDKRMESILPPQKNDLEFMISAVDHLIGNLFDFLEKEGLLENTVVYIYPDHLFMGRGSETVNSFPDKRSLYLITTATKESLPFKSSDTLHQIDISRVILDGAGINSNITFLSDFVKPTEKKAFLSENLINFLTLNEPKIERFDFSNQIRLSVNGQEYINGYRVRLSQEDKFSKSFENIKANKLYRIYFDKNMNLYKFSPVSRNKAFWRGGTAGLVFSIRNGTIYAYLFKGKFIGIAKEGIGEVLFNEQELDIFQNWAQVAPEIVPDPNKINLKSTSFKQIQSNGPGYVKTGMLTHKIGRGLNVLTVRDNVISLDTFDTYEDEKAAGAFVVYIDSLIKNKNRFIIVGHDSFKKRLKKYDKKLKEIGLPILKNMGDRQAYIAYLNNSGYVTEKKDERQVILELPMGYFKFYGKEALKNDRTRFIAHAGGMIGGKKYSNVLEALNLSYKNGFRYFELDIITTSDNKFVASHDWESWIKKTGFNGDIPPSEAEFLNQKIFGSYTPMNMQDINNWFESHPDAILVTDKINEPKKFADQFIDKSRLMMEVFTLEAFEEAKSLNIKGVLLSSSALHKIKGDKFQQLMAMGVEYLAISRRLIPENRELLLKLKEANVKVYVFHINFDKGIDEKYVFNYEVGTIYGMYADRWTFPDLISEN